MICIDRFDITKACWEQNILATRVIPHDLIYQYQFNFDLELLVADNGSKDPRIVDYMKSQPLDYYRENKGNEGVGKAFNQLYLRSTGKYIVLLGNDIVMPLGWLATAIDFLERVDNPGIAGVDWGHGSVPPITTKCNVTANYLNDKLNRVFGAWVLKRSVIEDLGFFYEGYGVYGIEDSDFNERVNRSGRNSFYIPGLRSRHLVNDVGQDSDYRRMKDKSLGENLTIFAERVKAWDQGLETSLRAPLPDKRDPYLNSRSE